MRRPQKKRPASEKTPPNIEAQPESASRQCRSRTLQARPVRNSRGGSTGGSSPVRATYWHRSLHWRDRRKVDVTTPASCPPVILASRHISARTKRSIGREVRQ